VTLIPGCYAVGNIDNDWNGGQDSFIFTFAQSESKTLHLFVIGAATGSESTTE